MRPDPRLTASTAVQPIPPSAPPSSPAPLRPWRVARFQRLFGQDSLGINSWVFVAALAIVTLGALALRLVGLDAQGDLDFDEQATAFIGSMPPLEMVVYLTGRPFEHPPLFYLLFHAWTRFVGEGETAMRLLSVLLGTVTVALVGALTARAAGAGAGLIAAAALAVSPLHVFYSRDARMYPLLGLLMVVGLFGATAATRKRGSRGGVIAAVLAAVSALATHYYALFGIVGVMLGAVRVRTSGVISTDEPRSYRTQPPGRLRMVLLLVIGGTVLLSLGWVLTSPGLRLSLSVAHLRWVDPAVLAMTVAESLGAAWTGPLAPVGWSVVAAGAVLAVLLTGRQSWMQSQLGVVAFWGVVVTCVGVPALLLLGRPFAPRFVALATPCLAILVGLALRRASVGSLSAAGVALISIAIGLWPIVSGYVRSDYGMAMATLRASVRPDDAIVLNGPWQELLYQRYGWGLPTRFVIASTVPLEAGEATRWLERITAAHARVWVVDSASDIADPNGVVRDWLDKYAYPRPVVEFHKALLRPYLSDRQIETASRAVAPGAAAPSIDSLLGVRLDTVQLERWELRPGDEARLRVSGGVDADVDDRRLVARLLDRDGTEVWHWEGALLRTGERVEYRAALVIPPSAPPGPYRLEGLVYRPVGSSGQPAQIGEPTELATVVVVPF